MPKRSNRFQRLIALLNATLADHAHVTESAMLTDAVTGEQREVDVLIRTRAATYDVAIGIEIVGWSRPAGTPWIEKMRGKHENLPTDKLILVSETGFSKPATKKARFHNIETLTIGEALSADWPLLSKLESDGVFEITTINFKCSIVLLFDDGTQSQVEARLNTEVSAGGAAAPLERVVRTILDRQEFRDALYPHITGAGEQDFWIQYTQPTPLGYVEHQGRNAAISELRIGLKVIQRRSPVSFVTGTYKSTPFVSGAGEQEAHQLQFVLAKKHNGEVTGYLFDGTGTRSLTADSPAA
jgi:hypothetical protein